MPGLYPPGEYDLVGTIVGAVEKRRLVTGQSIRPGDVVIGLPSSGLHTNGFSLARKIIFDQAGLKIQDNFPGTRRSVADVLLAVHRSYLGPVSRLLDSKFKVHGMAHLTGGGFQDNIPRILPDGALAVIDRKAWRMPPVFRFLREHGKVNEEELYRVFNMGIGFVIVVRKREAEHVTQFLQKQRSSPRVIGHIDRGRGGVAWS